MALFVTSRLLGAKLGLGNDAAQRPEDLFVANKATVQHIDIKTLKNRPVWLRLRELLISP